MKYRMDYITNSSSSSFLALVKNDIFSLPVKDNKITIGKLGTVKFDRSFKVVQNFEDKLNYLAINILYLENFKATITNLKRNNEDLYDYYSSRKFRFVPTLNYREILTKIIKEDLNVDLDWSLIKDLVDKNLAYIDHCSIYVGMNLILQSENSIKRFLYGNSILLQDDDSNEPLYNRIDVFFEKQPELYNMADSHDITIDPEITYKPYLERLKESLNYNYGTYLLLIDEDNFEKDISSLLKEDCIYSSKDIIENLTLTKIDKIESLQKVFPYLFYNEAIVNKIDISKIKSLDNFIDIIELENFKALKQLLHTQSLLNRTIYLSGNYNEDDDNKIERALAKNKIFKEDIRVYFLR